MSFGFGPVGPRAATSRPSPTVDAYGVQTWFKDASAAGAKDGTIIDATFLNQLIANLVALSDPCSVPITSNNANDDYLLRCIRAMADIRIALAFTASNVSAMLDGLHSTSWRDPFDKTEIIPYLDGAIGSDWRDVTPATVQAAIDARFSILTNGASSLFDQLNEIQTALNNDPNLGANLLVQIANETARAMAQEALLVPISAIVDNLTTAVANVPLSANQGVAIKALIDALTAALATEATTRAADDATEAAARAAGDATLTAALATETTNRANADTTLTTNLAAEVTRATGAEAALQALVTALNTLTGVAASATHLGLFTGGTIPNNVDIKAALQSLETALELRAVAAALATVATSGSAADLIGTLAAAQLPALTGDATAPVGTGVLTLAASGAAAGTYGSLTAIPVVTVDAKGRVINITTVAIPATGIGSF